MKKTKHNKFIRKGDKVYVRAGNDRGLIGEVLSRTDDKVTVQGVNVRKKHVKRTQENQAGGIIEIERPINISNVTLTPSEEKRQKVHVSFDENGNKQLVYNEGNNEVLLRNVK